MKDLKKFVSKILLISILINIFTFNTCLAYDNIDRYSKGSILIDQLTNRTLYEKNPDKKMPLASLSKMMTFLIAIESIKEGKVKENDIVEIDEEIAKVKGSSYKLKVGEKVPLIELMNGLMIVSGNDAAIAIAKHIGGTVDDFVKIMNQKTKDLGMKNTTFINPNGLPVYSLKEPTKPPMENISTPRDISILAKYMFDNYEKEVTSITDKQVYSYPERGFCKNNTNVLLQLIPDVDGVKTGYTGNAGYCLCFSMKIHKENNKNDCDNRLIGVVLGTNHKNKRTQASMSLLEYGKENFTTKNIIQKDELIGKKYIYGIPEMEICLKADNNLYIVCTKDEEIKSEVTLKEINYPVKKGDLLGVIKYYNSNGTELGKLDIVSQNNLDEISFKNKMKIFLKEHGF
ncbi:D-alanyl-D-alanine carboxypeptidase family protein [Intestinibacter bartlettii]|uniref:D-alanyl-D-alanine carboxypeptidase n=1 Tax=Intestinibacter bartlettii TaxID=261299 RepID=A0ABS6E056_9FIRM|nr:D-alanyl-D-alanine carboxypeptidase family protein [Intestinibacter bartlettii]MBU5337169.1 D-alanyl-D-alanine carboxypeptidase [Intestinibacter bartlettii]MDO5010169.1 D-alanyl-D-alanine carboxypeptidase family protein [Intestinibacter bartlettii]